MSRRRPLALALAGAAAVGSLAGFAVASPVPPTPVTGATPQAMEVAVHTSAYPVFDRHGHKATASWRISSAGGNCCETYISATPSGRLVESGGTYPWYTDDQGRHWFQVRFDLPDQNDNGKTVAGGEGATVVGSGGDVYGVTWDAYSGDHFQAYRYTAQTDSWKVADVLVKTPVYDRPWLTYAKGPFLLDGIKTPHILDATGGTLTKDVDTLSANGLDYGHPSYYAHDETQNATVKFRIKPVRNPDADWWQPHPGTSTLPLTAGGVLRFSNDDDLTGERGCDAARLRPKTSAWQCVKLAGTFQPGIIRQDSRGVLTNVYSVDGGTALELATSRDGGLHWKSTVLRPPGKTRHLETPDMYNVVANGRLGQAVVSARFDDSARHGQDVVFRVSTKHAKPQRLQTYFVGKGDLDSTNDVTGSLGDRIDYETVALLPDGTIAVTFDDSTCANPSTRDPGHHSPQVAILAE